MALPPGLPILIPSVAALFNTTVRLLSGDSIAAIVGFGPPQWGIYDQGGQPVLVADSVVSFDFKKEWVISNYPIEQGSFVSYNKVSTPFGTTVRMSQAGDESARAEFLDTLQQIATSLDLYTVVTPEIAYNGANIQSYDYRRTSTNGATMIVADIRLIEIRQTGSSTFTQTAQPSGANQTNGGQVQTQAPTQPQQSALDAILHNN